MMLDGSLSAFYSDVDGLSDSGVVMFRGFESCEILDNNSSRALPSLEMTYRWRGRPISSSFDPMLLSTSGSATGDLGIVMLLRY